MKQIVSTIALVLVFCARALSQGIDLGIGDAGEKKVAKVTASIVSEVKAAAAGQPFRVAVKLVHAPHHHTYGKILPPDGTGKITKLTWTLPDGWTADELPWPAPHELISTGGEKSLGYDETVYLPALIKPAGAGGTSVELAVKVDGLVCDPTSCMPFKTDAKLAITLAAAAEPDPTTAEVFGKMTNAPPPAAPAPKQSVTPPKPVEHSFVVYLIFAFIGGLILNVMPCVFPVLGIKVMGVVQQAGEDKKQVLLHGLAYTFGILICFWALGALVISLGKGWGFQLQSPGFVFGLCAFFLIFALNMAGVFEIGASAVGIGAELQTRHGLGGSFFSGLLATIVATPCSAPFLGSALGFAVTLSPLPAMLMFTMIGLGLASPFLLLAIAPRLISALPRPGAWMESFKQGMSFLLFGTAAFLVWVLTGMIEGQPMLFMLFGLVLIGLGCWIYGRWSLPHKPSRTRLIAVLLMLASVGGGMWMGWPSKEATSVSESSSTTGSLVWEVWSPDKVAQLRAAGTPVYIDFTAKWCLTCQVNKRIYPDAGLQALFQKKKVTLLKADWTNENDEIKQALAALGKAAVPVNVLYIPGQDEPFILPELLSVENVTAALNKLP
jgi:thiol:disulfide interchange protein